VYTARGEARLTIDALVSSGPLRDTRWTTGYGKLELKSPLLYVSTSFPKANRVRSPDSASMIKAGTNFAIRVKLENRSFTKTLLVQPRGFSVRGNAHGGKWQSAGLPIQPALDGVPDVAQCTCHEVIRLPPNTEQELDVVFGSWANDPRARKVPKGNRGTRADLRLLDFDVWVDLDDGTGLPEEQHRVEAVDPKDAIIDAKTRSHRLSFDDASAAKPPFDGAAAAVYFTAGAFQGAWDWTAGTVRGVFVDLPTMIGNGVLGLPTAAQKYVQLEVELWESIKDDPAAKLAYFNALQNQYLLAYKNAPALKQKAEEAWGGINSSVEEKYTAMFNEWYDGDWTVAATQFGNEGAQRFLDVASAVAPCVLARFPRAVEAMRAARAATYEQITASLASLSTRLRGSEAVRALATVTRLGYEYSPALLKQLYGFTDAQINDLRRIAEQYKVLITVRSRGYDALRWGEDVFFKPEPFKTKTVNWIDVEFLDYGDDIGRLVIKRPIGRAKLLKNLEVAGVEPGSARYKEVLLRYDQRVGEWNSKAFGMPQDLLGRTNRANRAGSMELEFNWSDNLIDPSLAPQQRSTIGVQLERSKRFRNGKEVAIADEWVVKVDYDGTGVYRSVVGDMDIVAITDLAGGPLADARHIEVIRALQGSSLKSPHMESGSWVKNGKFWFPAKEREFMRPNPLSGEAAIDAQFAPGSSVRAVAFNKKRSIVQGPLIGQDNNRFIFDGSLVHVGAE
jgi:hypothetical protein